jgi:hypothetical protein
VRVPPKEMWLRLELDDVSEFEFFLAETLGRTVAELDQMSNVEFLGWCIYFGRKAQRKELGQ